MHLVKTDMPFLTAKWNGTIMWELSSIAHMLKRTRS